MFHWQPNLSCFTRCHLWQVCVLLSKSVYTYTFCSRTSARCSAQDDRHHLRAHYYRLTCSCTKHIKRIPKFDYLHVSFILRHSERIVACLIVQILSHSTSTWCLNSDAEQLDHLYNCSPLSRNTDITPPLLEQLCESCTIDRLWAHVQRRYKTRNKVHYKW